MATNSNVSNSPPPTPSKKIGLGDWIFLVLGILLLLIVCIQLVVMILMIKDDSFKKDDLWLIFPSIVAFVIGAVSLWASKISNPGSRKMF